MEVSWMCGLRLPIRKYFLAQEAEIQADPVLKSFGFILAWIHIYTFLFWFLNSKIYSFIGSEVPAICQPFFQSCRYFRVFDAFTWRWLLVLYGTLGSLGIYLWCRQKIRVAYFFFIFLLMIKFLFYAQDYRLMGNYHYIFFLFSLIFVLVPRKIESISIFIVVVYLAAGSLKLNEEWLSGAALYGDLSISHWIPLSWLTAYVVILELGFSLLLFSKSRSIQLFSLLQFFIFHLCSIEIVGLYYPLIMFSLLSLPVLILRAQRSPDYEGFFKLSWARYLLVFFIAAQAYPKLFFPRSPVTGEGRASSLNMFDARATCRHTFSFQAPLFSETLVQDLSEIGVRIKCDPYLYLEISRNICQELKLKGLKTKVNLLLESRLSSEKDFKVVVDEKNLCAHQLDYSMLTKNSWIRE